jgi:hypothetical protein
VCKQSAAVSSRLALLVEATIQADTTGKREHTQEQLATATTMYRAMGMTYWLEKLQAEVATFR